MTFSRANDSGLPIGECLSRQFSLEMKNRLRLKLLELLPRRVNPLPASRVMVPGPNFCKGNIFWPQDGSLPDISQFASEESFLLFNVMDIDTDWLEEMLETPVENWSADPDFPKFSRPFGVFSCFTAKMHYDNDAAERWVRFSCELIGKNGLLVSDLLVALAGLLAPSRAGLG